MSASVCEDCRRSTNGACWRHEGGAVASAGSARVDLSAHLSVEAQIERAVRGERARVLRELESKPGIAAVANALHAELADTDYGECTLCEPRARKIVAALASVLAPEGEGGERNDKDVSADSAGDKPAITAITPPASSTGEDPRALCAEAARHLRTLPSQTESADIRLAERLEAASVGKEGGEGDTSPSRAFVIGLARVAFGEGDPDKARRILDEHAARIAGRITPELRGDPVPTRSEGSR